MDTSKNDEIVRKLLISRFFSTLPAYVIFCTCVELVSIFFILGKSIYCIENEKRQKMILKKGVLIQSLLVHYVIARAWTLCH